jgi:hypothetical protein
LELINSNNRSASDNVGVLSVISRSTRISVMNKTFQVRKKTGSPTNSG